VKIEVNNNGFIKNSYFKVEFKEPEMKKDKKRQHRNFAGGKRNAKIKSRSEKFIYD